MSRIIYDNNTTFETACFNNKRRGSVLFISVAEYD
jgi:hypothetical protein